ncbi:MAG: tyrosine-type recombinase/integrase [Pseudobdellovibrionaceae bacterium]
MNGKAKNEWVPLKNPRTGKNHFDTKSEGKLAFLEWLKWNEKKITQKDILFEDALKKYLELCKSEKAATTYSREKNHSQALKVFYNLPVSEVTLTRVEDFKKSNDWKPTTWALRLSLLKKVVQYAETHNFKVCPSFKAIKIPRPKIHEMMPRYVDIEVIDAVIEKLSGHHKAYAMILKHLLLRPNEAIKLKLEDVDFKNKVIRILGKNKHWEFLPFGKELEPYLKELPLKVSQGAFALALKRVCSEKKKWKLPKVTPYVFRHSSASALVNSNVVGGTRVVQALLRHKDPKLTARYAHPFEDTMRDALKVLGK